EPHQRFTSVQEFAEALEQASQAKRESVRETPRRGRRRAEMPSSQLRKNLLSSPGKAALLVLLLLVVLGAVASNSLLSFVKHQPIPTPRPASTVHASLGVTPTAPSVMPTAPSVSSAGWTMFGFDAQHTEDNTLEHSLNQTNIPTLQTAWTSYTGYNLHPPVVANGILYITSSQNVASPDGNTYPVSTLYALDSQTSKVLWKKSNLPVQAEGRSLYDDSTSDIYTVAVANGVVYAAAVSGMLDALNARTGAQIWSIRVTDAVSDTYQNAAPIVVNGTLYLHTINGNVYAVDARSGTVRWSTHVDVPTNPRNGGASIPTEANGVVYVGGSQYLYALDARNGAMLWRGMVNSWDPFTPVVAQGIVYAAADTGNVLAFNATGCDAAICSPLWNSSFGLSKSTEALGQINYPPSVANGVLYLGTVADPVFGGGYLFAVNARTGATLWKASIDKTGVSGEGGFYASPVVANGVVYVIGQDGQFSTFRAAGCGSTTCEPFWTANFRNNFGPGYSITVLDSSVYLTTPGGALYALRLP
ncbi:MAG TPA: PQQ-binding-like beta-propeller repeat protein, partial [Ktedonobacteraceae bacterium]